jgi:hypothetical protein
MSRSKRGSKAPGYEYWGRRGWEDKDITKGKERAAFNLSLKRNLTTEPNYNESEYISSCSDCRNGICPIFDSEGNQVGVNGDYNIPLWPLNKY